MDRIVGGHFSLFGRSETEYSVMISQIKQLLWTVGVEVK